MSSKGFYIINKSSKKTSRKKSKDTDSQSLYEKHKKSDLAYHTLHNEWEKINEKLQSLNRSSCNDTVVAYIRNCYNTVQFDRNENIIPCATLLTGVNQPDHSEQFSALKEKLKSDVTAHVATVYSADANSHKAIVEHVVYEFINDSEVDNSDSDEDSVDMEKSLKNIKLKKNRCTMSVLKCWYNNRYSKEVEDYQSPTKKHKYIKKGNQLVIILPDFEGYNPEVLQDFILNISFYTKDVPIVLIFGVATSSSALHKTFPYKVSSKLLIQVFRTQSSTARINQVLENVFLTHDCPFHLSGKAFQLLTDIFLFYDFSVTAFVQGFKSCMMEHYFGRNFNFLCCSKDKIANAVSKLDDEHLENVRHLPSFRAYVESDVCDNRIALITDNDFLKKRLISALEDIHTYLFCFHSILKALLILVSDLPEQPLGKQLRELYLTSTSTPITKTPEYEECIKMLHFQSKAELCEKLNSVCQLLDRETKKYSEYNADLASFGSPKKKTSPRKKPIPLRNTGAEAMSSAVHILKTFSERLKNSSLDLLPLEKDANLENQPSILNRQKLKEKLLEAVKKERKETTEFECVKSDLIKYLNSYIFEPFLKMPDTMPFYEIFFFADISNTRKHIVGTPWAAIHSALNNPVVYLQCQCCELPRPDSIIPSLPDISIVYKLHLECGKLINLYDWLQAFVCIVDPANDDDDDGERRFVKPEYHARFTKAVLELQLLGFIKPSKRKTDHVMRLTW